MYWMSGGGEGFSITILIWFLAQVGTKQNINLMSCFGWLRGRSIWKVLVKCHCLSHLKLNIKKVMIKQKIMYYYCTVTPTKEGSSVITWRAYLQNTTLLLTVTSIFYWSYMLLILMVDGLYYLFLTTIDY
jgi:hypothetical protein